ncbi:MAG: hypothetical protein IJH99_09195 [Eubacterium sp.]|nr:hypothetical protein [Eubacterium sp.]
MERVSTFIGSISVWHAPAYYDHISDYKFLYVKNGTHFIVKYHYYNGYASFATLIVPFTTVNDITLYEKENENSYSKEVIIMDDYKSILDSLSPEERKDIESCMEPSQRDESTIVSLLEAYELSGHSLI